MTEQQRPASSAMKPFVAGLILGLVVGGFAGAYLSVYTETNVPKLKPSGSKPMTSTSPRDERPGDIAPAATGPTGSPAAPSDPSPAPKPEQPK